MHSVIFFPAALFALGCATTTANQRGSAKTQQTSSCLDTLHASDSVTSVVKLTVRPQDSTTTKTMPPEYSDIFADEFKVRFDAPNRLPLSVVAGWEPCDSTGSRCVGGILNLGAKAYFTAHQDGRLTHISIVDATLTPALADTLLGTLEDLSKEQTTAWTHPPDSIPMEARLETEEFADSIPARRRLFRAVVPRYSLPFTSASMPASGVSARYPITAQLAGAGDTVVVAFTVDSDGSIAPESIDLMSGRYRDFILSVANALTSARYHPARLGDCAVATRMRQRFVFTSR